MTQDEARQTFDGATEWFTDEPTGTSAANLLTVAGQYWADGIIGDNTYASAVNHVRDWLVEPVPTKNTFTVEYALTERTICRINVEAENCVEALRMVEEYEVDTDGSRQVECLEFSISDVRLVERVA